MNHEGISIGKLNTMQKSLLFEGKMRNTKTGRATRINSK